MSWRDLEWTEIPNLPVPKPAGYLSKPYEIRDMSDDECRSIARNYHPSFTAPKVTYGGVGCFITIIAVIVAFVLISQGVDGIVAFSLTLIVGLCIFIPFATIKYRRETRERLCRNYVASHNRWIEQQREAYIKTLSLPHLRIFQKTQNYKTWQEVWIENRALEMRGACTDYETLKYHMNDDSFWREKAIKKMQWEMLQADQERFGHLTVTDLPFGYEIEEWEQYAKQRAQEIKRQRYTNGKSI